MENLPEKVPLYEMDIVKDMVGGLLGRGPAQMMASFRTAQVFYGLTALNQLSGFLKSGLEEEERRALIITDDFTEKYANQVITELKSIDTESLVWSGVEPEGPLYTIEKAVEVCEEFKPTVFIAIGGVV